MIIVKFSAGLGNQLYEYAMYRQLQIRFGKELVKADLSPYRGQNFHHGFELQRIFGKEIEQTIVTASDWDIIRISKQFPQRSKELFKFIIYVNRICKKLLPMRNCVVEEQLLCQRTKNRESQIADVLLAIEKLNGTENFYLDGYWVLPDYYPEEIDLLVKEIHFPELETGENCRIAKQIEDTNSVSVHIRRGDYLNTKYDVLTEKYYRKAFQRIQSELAARGENINQINWFFFSDDPEYVKETYSDLENIVIVTNNTGDNSFRDMQLMSKCKHNIIANSTFSEWGAIFNQNLNKIVIYQKMYERELENRKKPWKGWESEELE